MLPEQLQIQLYVQLKSDDKKKKQVVKQRINSEV